MIMDQKNLTGIVFDIKKYSLHDGPGIRTTVFLKGCPLECLWCHNPESTSLHREIMFWEDRCIHCGDCISVCPTHAFSIVEGKIHFDKKKCIPCDLCTSVCPSGALEMIGKNISVKEVMDEINKDTVFYDDSGGGVTFSGGEPFVQFDFLLALLKFCKQQEIHTAVDTTGFVKVEKLAAAVEYIDLFLYDLKLIDNSSHEKYTGVSNEPILSNLIKLSKLNKKVIIRIPIIPDINTDLKELDKIAGFVSSLQFIKEINILPYFPGGVEKYKRLQKRTEPFTTRQPSHKEMQEIAKMFTKHDFEVKIGG